MNELKIKAVFIGWGFGRFGFVLNECPRQSDLDKRIVGGIEEFHKTVGLADNSYFPEKTSYTYVIAYRITDTEGDLIAVVEGGHAITVFYEKPSKPIEPPEPFEF